MFNISCNKISFLCLPLLHHNFIEHSVVRIRKVYIKFLCVYIKSDAVYFTDDTPTEMISSVR